MEILLLLIPISLIFVFVALKAFFWAVDNEQFEDLDRASNSILFEEPDDDQ